MKYKFTIYTKYVWRRAQRLSKHKKKGLSNKQPPNANDKNQIRPPGLVNADFMTGFSLLGPKEQIEAGSNFFLYCLGGLIAKRLVGQTEDRPLILKKFGLVGLYTFILHFGDNATIQKGCRQSFRVPGYSGQGDCIVTSEDVIFSLVKAKQKYYNTLTLRMVAKTKSFLLNQAALHFLKPTLFYDKLCNQHADFIYANKLEFSQAEKALCFSFNTNDPWVREHYPNLFKILQYDYLTMLRRKK